jgi:ribosomal protein S18 acetylase RimI-like enzyme
MYFLSLVCGFSRAARKTRTPSTIKYHLGEMQMQVALAQLADIPAWLDLAAEVEFLFGPMVADPAFRVALERNIQRQTAFCMREYADVLGAPLMGALLFSATYAPRYKISWLAVSKRWRRRGVAQALVEHCFELLQPPAELSLITFGADNPSGQPARDFYTRMGFHAAECAANGPEGGTRQVYRRQFV